MTCFQLKIFWVGKKTCFFCLSEEHFRLYLKPAQQTNYDCYSCIWPWFIYHLNISENCLAILTMTQWYEVLLTFTQCSFADPLLSDWAILSSLSNQPCYWQHSWDTWAAACKWCNSRGYHSILVVCVLWIIHFIDKVSTGEIHRLDQWILDWTTAVAGKADTCQLSVSFTCHSSGPIYVTLFESTIFYGICIADRVTQMKAKQHSKRLCYSIFRGISILWCSKIKHLKLKIAWRFTYAQRLK